LEHCEKGERKKRMKTGEEEGERRKKQGERRKQVGKKRERSRKNGCIDWLSHSRGVQIIEGMFLLSFGKTQA